MNKREMIKVLATNLRVERARKHITQEFLAEKAGISTEYVTKIEGEKYNPTLFVVVKLAEALEISLDTLMPSSEFLK